MMSRTFQFGRWLGLLSTLTAAVWAVLALPPSANAAGFVYQQHTLNAGVLYPGSATDSAASVRCPAPYLFYVLNNRADARPSDMNLVNPQAPATVTPLLNLRWGYTVGTALTPNMAGYWEVPLHDASADQLHQYDVLYLVANGSTFSPADNEKLRRFVDTGGQLIVEYTSAAGTPGLFTDTTFNAVVGALSLPMTGGHFLRHPLLSQPYLLSYKESLTLGTPTGTITPTNDGINIFGPVVLNGAGDGIAAGQFGAGQIIVSGLNIGGSISNGNSANYVPPVPPAITPAQDLKFLSNVLSWSQTHPNEYKTSHGNASANGIAAFSPSWLYPLAGTAGTTPPGAAVWGNFVFVTDSAGILHAFDAYPSENLIGDPTAPGVDDAVAPADLDYSLGKPYDQIWSVSVGANASAPTVATHNKTTYVFIEKANGDLVAYNAVSGSAGPTLTAPTDATNYTAASYSTNAPSPTYYDGRLYAGQANGSLSVYDLNENASVNVPLTTTTPAAEAVSGPPSVGLLANGGTNILTALVPTTRNLYTVLLGARAEPLKTFNPNGALAGFSIDRGGRYGLNNLTADTNAAVLPALLAYDSGGNLNPTAPGTLSPQDPLFAITAYNSYFTDWDTDFASSTLNGSLTNLNFIAAGSYGDVATGATATGTGFSVPVFDRRGDYYYTLTDGGNSYLVGVTNAPHPSNVLLKFRFRMPTSGDGNSYKDPTTNASWNLKDADGVDYTNLQGYTFVGAPVVDDQGYVYAVASSGSSATVLCFRGNQGASADTAHTVSGTAPNPPIDLTQAVIRQQDEGASSQVNDIPQGQTLFSPNGTASTIGQFNQGVDSISFFNFGRQIGSPSQQIAGNLSEPQPVDANAGPTATFSSTALLLHTNLAWYVAPFATSGMVTGLSKVGPTLFLTDGTYLYKLSAVPSVGAGKVVAALPSRTLLNTTGSSLGTVGAAPSIGGNIMVVNGTNGLLALTRQVTVIADTNRVLGVDGDGSAVWSVDATTATNATGTLTKVPFSHPVSLSQFADNQYLAADTGNNRCVRFDPSGNVQWELTRFSDPNGLMAPGQPLTLSQPTSVQVHTSSLNTGGTVDSYLIADSGNDRIVEVTDTYDSTGALVLPSHILTWVTHTGDQYGRHYRYGSATYYQPPSSSTLLYVAATVTNTRLGKLGANGAPGTASSDAPGGSIVLFKRPAAPAAYGTATAGDLIYSTPGFYNAGGTAYTVKNPRFLQLNADLSSAATSPLTGTPFTFLYADDNGAFDLTYDTTKGAFVAETGSLQFTQTSYDNMTQPVIGDANPTTYSRATLPFVPTCIQRIDSDPTNPRYLITQTFSQAELGTPVVSGQAKIGGEIFEVDGSNTPVGGFGNASTLSHPALTGPLTQPAFALRVQ